MTTPSITPPRHERITAVGPSPVPPTNNTLGTTASPLTIAQLALQMSFDNYAPLDALTIDVTPEIVQYGQEVVVPVPVPIKSKDFYDPTGGTSWRNVNVTINRFRKVEAELNIVELTSAQTPEQLINLAEPMSVGIRDELMGTIQEILTEANFPQHLTATGDDLYAMLAESETQLAKARGPRFAAINSSLYKVGLLDPVVKQSQAFNATNGEILPDGVLPRILNHTPYRHDFPAGSLIGFSGTRQAIVMAARCPLDPTTLIQGLPTGMTMDYVQINLPQGGTFRVLVNAWIESDLKIKIRMSWMYGINVGIPECGCRWLAAAPSGDSIGTQGITLAPMSLDSLPATDDPAAALVKRLESYRKDDLIAMAAERSLTVTADMRKADIINLLVPVMLGEPADTPVPTTTEPSPEILPLVE